MAVLIVPVGKLGQQGADEVCALRFLVLATVASIVVRIGCEECCIVVHLICLLHQILSSWSSLN